MIERALKRLGVKKCRYCNKLVDRDKKSCKRCGENLTKTSTPEDGL